MYNYVYILLSTCVYRFGLTICSVPIFVNFCFIFLSLSSGYFHMSVGICRLGVWSGLSNFSVFVLFLFLLCLILRICFIFGQSYKIFVNKCKISDFHRKKLNINFATDNADWSTLLMEEGSVPSCDYFIANSTGY